MLRQLQMFWPKTDFTRDANGKGAGLGLRLELAAQKVKAVPSPVPPLMIASESEMPVGTFS